MYEWETGNGYRHLEFYYWSQDLNNLKYSIIFSRGFETEISEQLLK